MAKIKKMSVKGYFRKSKNRKRKHRVKGYTRPVRKKGRKLRVDPKPIVIKKYLVRDKSGHIVMATEHPIKFKKEHKKRLL